MGSPSTGETKVVFYEHQQGLPSLITGIRAAEGAALLSTVVGGPVGAGTAAFLHRVGDTLNRVNTVLQHYGGYAVGSRTYYPTNRSPESNDYLDVFIADEHIPAGVHPFLEVVKANTYTRNEFSGTGLGVLIETKEFLVETATDLAIRYTRAEDAVNWILTHLGNSRLIDPLYRQYQNIGAKLGWPQLTRNEFVNQVIEGSRGYINDRVTELYNTGAGKTLEYLLNDMPVFRVDISVFKNGSQLYVAGRGEVLAAVGQSKDGVIGFTAPGWLGPAADFLNQYIQIGTTTETAYKTSGIQTTYLGKVGTGPSKGSIVGQKYVGSLIVGDEIFGKYINRGDAAYQEWQNTYLKTYVRGYRVGHGGRDPSQANLDETYRIFKKTGKLIISQVSETLVASDGYIPTPNFQQAAEDLLWDLAFRDLAYGLPSDASLAIPVISLEPALPEPTLRIQWRNDAYASYIGGPLSQIANPYVQAVNHAAIGIERIVNSIDIPITNADGEVVSTFTDAGGVVSGIGSILSGIPNPTVAKVGAVVEAVGKITTLVTHPEKFAPVYGEGFSATTVGLSIGLGAIGSVVGGTAGAIISGIGSAVDTIIRAVHTAATNFAAGLAGGIFSGIGIIGGLIGGPIGGIVGSVAAAVGAILLGSNPFTAVAGAILGILSALGVFSSKPAPHTYLKTTQEFDLNNDGRPDHVRRDGWNRIKVDLAGDNGGYKTVLDLGGKFGGEGLAYMDRYADVDNDGKIDLIFFGEYLGHASIFRGRGDGTFKPEYVVDIGDLGLGKYRPSKVQVFDYDGRNGVDIVLYKDGAAAWILLNNGTGTFSAAKPASTVTKYTGEPRTYVRIDLPDGTVAAVATDSFREADVNGDGSGDTIFVHDNWFYVAVSRPNGQAPVIKRTITYNNADPYKAQYWDATLDGRSDQLYDGRWLSIGMADGTFVGGQGKAIDTWGWGSGDPSTWAAARQHDLNGDGRNDWIFGNAARTNWTVNLADGTEHASNTPITNNGQPIWTDMSFAQAVGDVGIADVNGDGRLDRVWRDGWNRLQTVFGLAGGGFSSAITMSEYAFTSQPAHVTPTPPSRRFIPGQISYGDVDGDGFSDAILLVPDKIDPAAPWDISRSQTTYLQVAVLRGSASGFVASAIYSIKPSQGTNYNGISYDADQYWDYNFDGRIDLIYDNYRVHLGQTDAKFGAVFNRWSYPSTDKAFMTTLAFRDINGDGRKDVVLDIGFGLNSTTRLWGHHYQVYLAKVDGSYQLINSHIYTRSDANESEADRDQQILQTFGEQWSFDLTGDGIKDAVWRDLSNRLWVATGTGNGNFGDAWELTTLNISDWRTAAYRKDFRLVFGDVDGDGNMDALWEYVDGRIWLYQARKGASSQFDARIAQWNPSEGPWGSAGRAELQDVNGDGRADLVRWVNDTNYLTWLGETNAQGAASLQNGYFGSFTGRDGRQINGERLSVDINGDGIADSVFRHGFNGLFVARGLANGRYEGTVTALLPVSYWQSTDMFNNFDLEIGDVDGDGMADLVWEYRPDGRIWVQRNRGGNVGDMFLQNSFEQFDPEGQPRGGQNWDATLFDINQDDRADLVRSQLDSAGNPTAILAVLGQANATFNGVLNAVQKDGQWTFGDYLRVDLNGDHFEDLVRRFTNNQLTVELGIAGGKLSGNMISLNNGHAATSALFVFLDMTWGDVNGDGRSDMLLSARDGRLWVSLGTASGGLTLNVVSGVRPDYWSGGAGRFWLQDMTGDGRADLIFQRDSDGWQVISQFSATTTIINPAGSVARNGEKTLGERILADVDGDGRADSLFRDANNVLWRSQAKTDGSFATPAIVNTGFAATQNDFGFIDMDWGDVDGDGRADALFTSHDNRVWIHKGTAAGGLQLSWVGSEAWQRANSQAANEWGWSGWRPSFVSKTSVGRFWLEDVTGDGRSDLVWERTSDKWRVVTNFTGTGNLRTIAGQNTGNSGKAVLGQSQTMDINGDGVRDSAWRDPNGTLWIAKGTRDANGRTTFGEYTVQDIGHTANQANFRALGTDWADVDGDGRSDLLVWNRNDGRIWISRGKADGTLELNWIGGSFLGNAAAFGNYGHLPSLWQAGGTYRLHDVTGDGRADLIYENAGYVAMSRFEIDSPTVGPAFILLHTTNGGVLRDGAWILGSQAFADINGDRRNDSVFYDTNGNLRYALSSSVLAALPPLANGTFLYSQGLTQNEFGHALNTQSFNDLNIGLGDVNGDGLADLLQAHRTDGRVWIRKARLASTQNVTFDGWIGAGVAGTPAVTSGYGYKPSFFAAEGSYVMEDINGDLRADLVYRNGDVRKAQIFNSSGGVLATVNAVKSGDNFVYGDRTMADVDGDGLLDAVFRPADTMVVYTAFKNLNGLFGDIKYQVLHDVPVVTFDMTLGDLNNDGKADVVASWWDGATMRVTANRAITIRNLQTGQVTDGFVFTSWKNRITDDNWNAPGKIWAEDITGDGWSELLYRRDSDGFMTMIRFDANGNIVREHHSWLNPETNNFELGTTLRADLNGDKIGDRLFWESTGNRMASFGSETNGLITYSDSVYNLSPVGVTSDDGTNYRDYRLMLGDVNGDGKADAVWEAKSGNRIWVRLNNTTGTNLSWVQSFSVANQDFGGTGSTALTDIDGDGRMDLVRTATDLLGIKVSFGQTNGTFGGTRSLRQVVLNGDAGNNSLAHFQADTVFSLTGGDGDDYLLGGSYSDYLDGGAGDDRLAGGGGNDQYAFGWGAGVDSIIDQGGKRDAIMLAKGVAIEHLVLRWTGTVTAPGLITLALEDPSGRPQITIRANDRLTFNDPSVNNSGFDNRIEALQFSDGTALDLERLVQALASFKDSGGEVRLGDSRVRDRVVGLLASSSVG